MSTHPLCSTCGSIDYKAPCHGPEYKKNGSSYSTHLFYSHHDTVAELELCVEVSECTLCRLVLATIKEYTAEVFDDWEHAELALEEALSEFDDRKVSDSLRERDARVFVATGANKIRPDGFAAPIMIEVTFRKPIWGELEHRTTDITMHWTDASSGSRQSTIGAMLVTDLSNEMSAFLSNRELGKDFSTGSPRAIELGRLWLNSCTSSHENCRERRADRAPLPTGVIDVSDETGGVSLFASTATQTDDLCIIQDSVDDWNREAKEMGRYYRAASVTIFARHSSGDEQGCFKNREGDPLAPCRSPMFDGLVGVMKSGTNSISFIQRLLNHKNSGVGNEALPGFENFLNFEAVPPSSYKGPLGSSVLHTRGWTLQETVLSTRSLIFTDAEVKWLCPHMSACECLPEGIPRIGTVDQSVVKIHDPDVSKVWSSNSTGTS